MKFLGYILRNVRRNPVRTLLTIASLAISLTLVMILAGFIYSSSDSAGGLSVYNRIVVMSSQGFARPLPIAMLRDIRAMPGVVAATPFVWFGGKVGDEAVPFAQFAIDPETLPTVFNEYRIKEEEYQNFLDDRTGCVIGRKLAEDRGWKVGDQLPLRADLYPFDLNLTIVGILDADAGRDLRNCMFRWDLLDETLKANGLATRAGNAGVIFAKCENAARMAPLCKEIDDTYRNSDSPTRSQTEEAFAQMFAEFLGSLKTLIQIVGASVVVSLVLVAGNAMAMAMRERTTEVAVLRAIGFRKRLVLGLVLVEAVLVAGVGGLIGSVGAKLAFDVFDLSSVITIVPFFLVPWKAALGGLLASLAVGLLSGVIPATIAANTSVVNGLRKVV